MTINTFSIWGPECNPVSFVLNRGRDLSPRREYGCSWPVVRALYGLHPVRRQEGPLVFYLMGVPGLWSVPY